MAPAGGLNEYYDEEKCVLNHYKFGFFMKKGKRVYITFMEPDDCFRDNEGYEPFKMEDN